MTPPQILDRPHHIALIGAGRLGQAMLRGWAANNVRSWAECSVFDPAEDARKVAEVLGFAPSDAVETAQLETADAALFAVKPHLMEDVAKTAAPLLAPGTLVISVAAGLDLAHLRRWFPGAHVVRAMPNSAAAVGQSITVFVADPQVTADQLAITTTLLSALGKVEQAASEADMDAVTAVSGSGPAYVYLLTEALAQAGVTAGLPPTLAAKLARQTIIGAGRMLDDGQGEPEALRAAVTSPGGTTQAALEVLDAADGLRDLMDRAVQAAINRARELNH